MACKLYLVRGEEKFMEEFPTIENSCHYSAGANHGPENSAGSQPEEPLSLLNPKLHLKDIGAGRDHRIRQFDP
jgi:hypothetical protein